jgi:hypothetical protein
MTTKHEDPNPDSLVSVHEATDEAEATLLVEFLKSQGIDAEAVPVQNSWLGPVLKAHNPYWGQIEVLGKDADRARELIEDYLRATPQPDAPEETS